MIENKGKGEKGRFSSPLELLYAAYSDERPVFTQAMEAGFRKLDTLLVSLSEQDREQAIRAIYEIYTENEAQAFQAGVRTGVRLAKELL